MSFKKIIVLTEDMKEVRFFAIGKVNNDGRFTGMMHDYIGGGQNQEKLIFNDKWLPETDDGEVLEWDEQTEIFDNISPFSYLELDDEINKFMDYDTEKWNYVLADNFKHENKREVVCEFNEIPYGLGHSIFSDSGYIIAEEIDFSDIKRLSKIRKFINDVAKTDVMKIGDSPLLDFWDVSLEDPFDIISTRWEEEDCTYEFGLNEDDIKNIYRKDGNWILESDSNKYFDTVRISLYKLEKI